MKRFTEDLSEEEKEEKEEEEMRNPDSRRNRSIRDAERRMMPIKEPYPNSLVHNTIVGRTSPIRLAQTASPAVPVIVHNTTRTSPIRIVAAGGHDTTSRVTQPIMSHTSLAMSETEHQQRRLESDILRIRNAHLSSQTVNSRLAQAYAQTAYLLKDGGRLGNTSGTTQTFSYDNGLTELILARAVDQQVDRQNRLLRTMNITGEPFIMSGNYNRDKEALSELISSKPTSFNHENAVYTAKRFELALKYGKFQDIHRLIDDEIRKREMTQSRFRHNTTSNAYKTHAYFLERVKDLKYTILLLEKMLLEIPEIGIDVSSIIIAYRNDGYSVLTGIEYIDRVLNVRLADETASFAAAAASSSSSSGGGSHTRRKGGGIKNKTEKCNNKSSRRKNTQKSKQRIINTRKRSTK